MDSRLFDDLARVASGALGAFGGVRDQMEAQLRAPLERMVRQLDLVTRDEFEAVQMLAARAREEQEKLAERVEALERAIAGLSAGRQSVDPDPLALQGVPPAAATRRTRGRARTVPPKPLPPDQE